VCAAWYDFLKWAGDYRPSLDELADLGGEHVYVAIALAGAGRSSAVQMDARFFDVFTVRDGLILRIEEYTDQPEALEAVGLSE
jgi:ketosteroid isomerase-like protein